MQANNRIIINTLAQYARTIINMLLSLYSSRLVLEILGIDDYGIYALVGGVVSMLSFITNSLVGSTQRFLSVSQGYNDKEKIKEIFSNSLIIHIVLGIVTTIVLSCLTSYLFNGFLNIDTDKIITAKKIYQLVIWMVCISFISSPFRALLVSRENIVYISIIDVIDGILKVILVIFLNKFDDKLLAYGWIMFSIRSFNFLSFMMYCYLKYEECILPRFRKFNINYLKDLSKYTGWILYSTGIITLRIQGLAIVLNKFLGTAINAAYGIGTQISGMIGFISTSLNNAIAPQIMSSSGSNKKDRMWRLAEMECKYSFLLLAMIGIPTMFEIQTVLELWLVEVPKNAGLFSCLFISLQIIDLMSTGLSTVNKAMGNIGKYTFLTYTPKIIIVPISILILMNGTHLIAIFILSLIIEVISVILRIFLIKKNEYFSPIEFCKKIIYNFLPPVVISIIVCGIIRYSLHFNLRFLLTYPVSIAIFIFSTYFISLNDYERTYISFLLHNIKNKIKQNL